MTNFELYIYGGSSIQTLLQKWAQSPEESAIWRQKAYEKFIKTGLEDNDKLKIIFNQMLNSDVSSNTAFLQDESVVGKNFEQSIHKYDRAQSWIYIISTYLTKKITKCFKYI